jgi:hypothetical protein
MCGRGYRVVSTGRKEPRDPPRPVHAVHVLVEQDHTIDRDVVPRGEVLGQRVHPISVAELAEHKVRWSVDDQRRYHPIAVCNEICRECRPASDTAARPCHPPIHIQLPGTHLTSILSSWVTLIEPRQS